MQKTYVIGDASFKNVSATVKIIEKSFNIMLQH